VTGTTSTASGSNNAGMHKHYRHLWTAALLLFVLLALAIHYPAFHGPMYYDSLGRLGAKEHIYASGDVLKVMQLCVQRPLSMASFYLNYLIWGMNPFYFRMVNAIILAMTAFVAAAVFNIIFGITGSFNKGHPRAKQAVSLFLGLVFLVHPVHVYLVDYIWQRAALLACFFYISALAAYLAARAGKIRHTPVGYGLCLVFFCLALASKENAVTLPLLLVLAEIAFFRSKWQSVLKRAGVFALIVAVLIGFLSFLERPHGMGAESAGILGTVASYYKESNLTLWELVVTQCNVLYSYLALIVAPTPSNVRFMAEQVIFRSPLESFRITASVVGAVILFGTGIFLIRKRPLTGFGLLFFLINLAPEALLVPQYLYFAYRASLPMFGLLLVLADGLQSIVVLTGSARKQRSYTVAFAAVISVVALLGLMCTVTVLKANLFRDPVLFWTDIAKRLAPYDPKMEKFTHVQALGGLGSALQGQGKTGEAAEIYEEVMRIEPLHSGTYAQLGLAYAQLGRIAEAESVLEKAVGIAPDADATQFVLANFYETQDRLSAACLHMQRAVDLDPTNPRYLNGLGKILLRQGKASEAASYFRQAITVAPASDEAHYNLGEACVSMGMDDEATRHFRKTLELRPASWQALHSLGLVLARSGKVNEAEMHFREALALSPRNWRIHNNLGVLLAKDRRFAEAEEHFEQAVKHNPEDVSARKNLDRVHTLKGSPSAK
jgi:protein O-mannosyl-transferase